ncbi:SgcJ/EcaC family oxidoreductase [Tsukamurella sp. 8F]|uniref:SgcJ/EcaC family oxidoreductase n=1 Tax=unclassified Tsukamurella TaxID=2633480 RepID=UPI0023B88BBE|nr:MULTISPECIES: SgcJ/EcaC family oxidoreductase [unclassified Tsukamurella]MDF0529559.1 SgcJ/EcaC family oxidoreductase [Tsukamurella sp. 8J]MDF0585753.1 SgcJ/EcaC family oxidoreductase [Tsukamurella sp. 8F]
MSDSPHPIAPLSVGGTDDDVRAVVEFVQRLPRVQRAGRAAEFRELFREDAVWTTAHGRRLTGRAAIDAFTATALPRSMADHTGDYDIERILFVRPDVAVVTVRVRPHALDGARLRHVPDTAPLYVLSRDDGRWRIAAAQSTAVFDDAGISIRAS